MKQKQCDCPECRAKNGRKKLTKKQLSLLPAAILIVEVDWEKKDLKRSFKGFRFLCADENDPNHGTLFVGNSAWEAMIFFFEWLDNFDEQKYRIEIDEGVFVFAEATENWELISVIEG